MSVEAVAPRRKSVPITEHELQRIEHIRTTAAYQDALRALTGVDATSASEALLLQALLLAGIRAVQHHVEETGYAQLADQIDWAEHRRMHRRWHGESS